MISKVQKIGLGLLLAGGVVGAGAGAVAVKETNNSQEIIKAADGDVAAGGLIPGNSIYLTPGTNWKNGSAKFGYYFANTGETVTAWSPFMTAVDGNTDGAYQTIVPSGEGVVTWALAIAVRYNPAKAAGSWDSKWDQSVDLKFTGVQNGIHVLDDSWSNDTNDTIYSYNPSDRATLYGKQFLAATADACTGHNVTSAIWTDQETKYNVMGADAKSWFKNVTADVAGATDLPKAAARYDLIRSLAVYSSFSNFANR